jgi:DNA topoisomerase-1
VILVISEKPSAAEKIAYALGEAKRIEKNGAYYFEMDDMAVVPAVGHLFGLKQSVKGSFYPVFDVRWAPTFEISKKNEYSRKYFENIQNFQNSVDEVVIATDYDTEGSVIGYNIYRFLFPEKKVRRMKFSTLTRDELKKSYEDAKGPDMRLIEAGLTRHNLDWYYGINLSRALTTAIKSTGKVFSIVSVGRVQGPMLKFLADREREIAAFEPVPFWQIALKFKIGKELFDALYKDKQIWDEKAANRILDDCKGKDGFISDVIKTNVEKKPPCPFDLTSLQTEAYNLFGYSPKQTVDIAQSLYSDAYISYPRTSSQKLPKQLDLRAIVEKLIRQVKYKKFCDELLKGKMLPNEGKKKDPAHPAIHPTGEIPKELSSTQKKVYDLIVRRFLSCFGDPAKRESMRVRLDIAGHEFRISGSRTLEKGWMEIYEPYLRIKEVIFPEIKKDDKVNVKKLEKIGKETQPPSRYSQGSILKELESRDIGTKATRAQILQTLYDRGYIREKSIEVTKLGMELVKAMEIYAPQVIDEELTRSFEKEMDGIMNGKKKQESVLSEAKKILEKTLEEFRKNEKEVGEILDKALMETRENERTLGVCNKCGGELKLIFTKRKTRFVGCSGYPKCNNAYPVPQGGMIKKTEKNCEKCGTPIVYVFRKGKRPFRMCLDPNCETKADWNKKAKKE